MRRALLALPLIAAAFALPANAAGVCQDVVARFGVCAGFGCNYPCRSVYVDPTCQIGDPAIGACYTWDRLYLSTDNVRVG